MSAELLSTLAPFLDRLLRTIQTDPQLRQEVAALGKALTRWCELGPDPKLAPNPFSNLPISSLPHLATIPGIPSYGKRFEDPTSSGTAATPHAPSEDQTGWMPQEPTVIAGRCRIKGEAAKLLGQRVGNLVDEPRYLQGVAELRTQAERFPKCALWMLDMASLSRVPAVWEELAGAYHTAAEAADFLQLITDPASKAGQDQIRSALNLAAEAQSLLFSAVIDTGNSRPDADQIQLYVTVRELAAARGIYIHRYLRREDRVDPKTWPDLRKRIALAMEPFAQFQKRTVNSKKILGNIKFKIKRALLDGPERYDEWPRVMELLDEAISFGIPPEHPEFREALLPVIEKLPEDVMVPVAVQSIVRELDRYLATVPMNGKVHSELLPSIPTERVSETRGQSAILIGGLRREQAFQEIFKGLEFAALRWIEPQRDLADVERTIAIPETSLVIYSVRWSSHPFSDIRRICAAYGKRLIRLPGAYSATAILDQLASQPNSSLVIA